MDEAPGSTEGEDRIVIRGLRFNHLQWRATVPGYEVLPHACQLREAEEGLSILFIPIDEKMVQSRGFKALGSIKTSVIEGLGLWVETKSTAGTGQIMGLPPVTD